MKLESSPKLDSKTSQTSNSKSKSPKIQRAKTSDSKKPAKSKNSSKIKSFIRTIPISIALASALSSQAVADWQQNGLGNIVDSNGTIANNVTMNGGKVIYLNNDQSSPDLTIMGNITSSSSATDSDNGSIEIRNNSIAGTITNNGIFTASGNERKVIHVYGGSTLKAFVNNGVVRQQSIRSMIYLKGGSTIQNIINNGTMIQSGGSAGWAAVIHMDSDRTNVVNNVVFANGSTTSNTQNGAKNIINIGGNRGTIGNITANGNAKLNGNFAFGAGTITNGITFNGTSAMTGNISSSGRIGSIVLNDSSTIGGNISLTGGASIANGISIQDSASMTGAISLAGSSRISKILIDGSNMGGSANGTPKLAGNITMDGTSAIANGITITNGGTYAGTIHNRNSSSIGGVVVDNGTIVGDIIASGTSRLNGITIVNGGEMRGNIEASWVSGSNGHTMNLGNIDIQSRLQGGITLANAATIESLSLSNGGTITNAVSIGAGGSNGHTSILKTITLNGASGINSLVVGSSSDNAGTINSITLGGNSSIGSINVAQRGTIANLDIGNASQVGSIGSITNAGKLQNITLNNTSTITNGITNNSGGTISNIALNGASTITNGITNNSGGTISNITLASSNTIHNGIKNDGVITEINHNVAGVENAVTNNAGGSISKLIISQGTIEYNGEGAITEELSVKGGATLSMNSGSGTITMNGAVGSKLNLESGSTFKGSLKNTGSISSWSNVSNIEGSFINDAGANIGSLSAGQIAENLLNKGNIGDLTIDNVVGTLSNESEITTLSVQNRVANGILNSGNIQTLKCRFGKCWG